MIDPQEPHDSRVVKRSVLLAGHKTSVTMEAAFWGELDALARARGVSINQLVAGVDAKRQGSLSAALRVFVLKSIKKN